MHTGRTELSVVQLIKAWHLATVVLSAFSVPAQSACVCVGFSERIFVCEFMHACDSVCVCVTLCVHVCVKVCVFVYVHECVCVFVCGASGYWQVLEKTAF